MTKQTKQSKREKREQKRFIAEANKLMAEINGAKETEKTNVQKDNSTIVNQVSGEDIPLCCPGCEESKYVYVYDDNRTCYCVTCGLEFDLLDGTIVDDRLLADDREISSVSVRDVDTNAGAYLTDEYAEIQKEANRQVSATQLPLPGVTPEMVAAKFAPKTQQPTVTQTSTTGYTKTGTSYSYNGSNLCSHYPTHVISGRGWDVYAGKKDDCKQTAHNFNVVMNLSGYSIKQEHSIPIPALKKWEQYHCDYAEMLMDWPDYGVVTLPVEFWQELIIHLRSIKGKLLVFCIGGHGRTGTAIACLLVVGLGWTAKRAISWVRKTYCTSAIESLSQERYIRDIEKQMRHKSWTQTATA